MMGDGGMRFAEQHDRGALEAREHAGRRQRFAVRRVQPLPDPITAFAFGSGKHGGRRQQAGEQQPDSIHRRNPGIYVRYRDYTQASA